MLLNISCYIAVIFSGNKTAEVVDTLHIKTIKWDLGLSVAYR